MFFRLSFWRTVLGALQSSASSLSIHTRPQSLSRRQHTDPAATLAVQLQQVDCAPRNSVRIGSYDSLHSLSQLLQEVESDCHLTGPTVIIVLAANFCGHLPSLIRRSKWGRRLVLVVETGRVPLPGKVTIADLAIHEGILGWGQIVFERNLNAAINDSLQILDSDDSLILLWPDWITRSMPLHLLDRDDCEVQPLIPDMIYQIADEGSHSDNREGFTPASGK